MEDCIFCKIVKKEIPSTVVKETDDLLVFKNIKPSAPIHLLIIPKTHFDDISQISDSLWLEMRKVVLELATENKATGYRISNNTGDAAMIKHMHLHFMAGISAEREV